MSIEINETTYNNEPKQVLENQRNIEKYKNIEDTCTALKEECIDLRNESVTLKNETQTLKGNCEDIKEECEDTKDYLDENYSTLNQRVTNLENNVKHSHCIYVWVNWDDGRECKLFFQIINTRNTPYTITDELLTANYNGTCSGKYFSNVTHNTTPLMNCTINHIGSNSIYVEDINGDVNDITDGYSSFTISDTLDNDY